MLAEITISGMSLEYQGSYWVSASQYKSVAEENRQLRNKLKTAESRNRELEMERDSWNSPSAESPNPPMISNLNLNQSFVLSRYHNIMPSPA